MDCGQTLLCPFFCPSECCHLRAFALSPSVLGFPKETKPIGYIYIYIYMERFIKGIGSGTYGSQEVPQSVVCKLENQEGWCYNSVWVQRSENQRRQWWNSLSKVKGLRTRGHQCKSQSPKAQEPGTSMSKDRRRWRSQLNRKGENSFFLHLFVPFRPPIDLLMPTHIGEDGCFPSVY